MMNWLNQIRVSDNQWLAYGVWVFAAILFLISGGYIISSATESSQKAHEVLKPLAELSVNRKPLIEETYQASEAQLKLLFPGLVITSSGQGLKISGRDEKDWSDWLAALAFVPLTQPEAIWEIGQACAGSECGAEPYSATLVGVTQHLEMK